jgi:hypothetical protein
MLVPPALVLDAWYALRGRHGDTATTRWAGALLYAVVLLAVGLPYMAGALPVPGQGATTMLASVAVGLPAGLAATLIGARMGRWLAGIGRPQASRADAAAGQSASRDTAPAALVSAAEQLAAGAPPQPSLATADASRAGGARW